MATAVRERLPATVYALGAVSLLTDLASEMVVPVLPALVASLGGTWVWLGLVQGTSDALVSGWKLLAGTWSDRGARKPFVVGGYLLSALVRPLFALVAAPWQVVLVRAGDRVGKGLRGAPRDALLTDAVPKDRRGEAFGVQRAMDHAGACGGALAAFLLLAAGCELRLVFALALLPGLAGVLVAWRWVHEAPSTAARAHHEADPPTARRALVPLLPFVVCATVANGCEVFLLVRAGELGVPVAQVPLLWCVLHVVRAALAQPFGAWSDRRGRPAALWLGAAVQVAVLLAFVVADGPAAAWGLFVAYGLHAAITEGAERGLVADRTGARKRGATFGAYHAVQGLAGLGGPLLLGWLWDVHGAAAALGAAALASAAAAGLLGLVRPAASARP